VKNRIHECLYGASAWADQDGWILTGGLQGQLSLIHILNITDWQLADSGGDIRKSYQMKL